MIRRDLEPLLLRLAGQYPVLTITGPRQAGKTTLCRSAFPQKPYVSLEAFDIRDQVRSDPRGFLAQYADGAILDEIQNVPELTSYLQADVDGRPEAGRFVLTGSQHLGLTDAVSQSLAGRTAMLQLLPPSLAELRRFESAPRDLLTTLWMGAYPRIHDRGIAADRWLADYVTTYLQRDVRQVLDVGNLEAFTSFVRHCAGRTACEVNLSALGADAGVSHNTARAWLSVLEAGYLVFRVPSWQPSLRKRLVKAPKLHFVDTGLACSLLGITEPEQLRHHPLRGALFESWVAAEVLKARCHRGQVPALSHYRDARGLEVDLVLETGRRTLLLEAKSGATPSAEAFAPMLGLSAQLGGKNSGMPMEALLVHGGEGSQTRQGVRAVPWSALDSEDW